MHVLHMRLRDVHRFPVAYVEGADRSGMENRSPVNIDLLDI